jgi:hypothetical protein
MHYMKLSYLDISKDVMFQLSFYKHYTCPHIGVVQHLVIEPVENKQ